MAAEWWPAFALVQDAGRGQRALYRVKDVPWWRVVRADRTLAPEIAARQAKRLRAEGVRINGRRIVGALARRRSSP